MSTPEITIAICTHNRFDDLVNALDGLKRQSLPSERFEILIVDNSTDVEACRAFRSSNALSTNVRWLDSNPPGLSRARNMALQEASTSLIAFLDDDATPSPGWVAALLTTFRDYPDVVVVAGPIDPDWCGLGRPEWLPQKYEACLAILDHGSIDRPLGNAEYGWGANFAVRKIHALAVGGFDESLGRKGGMNLLSNEEIIFQDRLRSAGHSARYAVEARVKHRMRADRLTRDWFRTRLAWQAVSDSLQDGGWPWLDWSKQELLRSSAMLGVGNQLSELFAPTEDHALFANQLDAITSLIRVVLALGKGAENQLETIHLSSTDGSRLPLNEVLSDVYRPSAAVSSSASYVFAEYKNSHGFLADLYCDLPDSVFVELPGQIWHDDATSAIAYLEASIPPNARAVVILTLDRFSLDAAGAELLSNAIKRWRIPTIGIQHRLPKTQEQRDLLMKVAKQLHCVIGLSEDVVSRLKSHSRVTNVVSIACHPSKFRYVLQGQRERTRTAIGASSGHTVFAMIGEARAGKGIELLLAALDHLTPAVRDGIFLLFAGKATNVDPEQIVQRLASRRVAGRVDLRLTRDSSDYAVLTSSEYADAIAASDYGLLLYQESQRDVVSGALSDFIWQRKPVVATRDSFVGADVARFDLGSTLDDETPEALAKIITDLVSSRQKESVTTRPSFEAYRESHSPKMVLASLKDLLCSTSMEKTLV